MSRDDSLELLLASDSLSSSSYQQGQSSAFVVGQRVEAVLGTKKDKSPVGGVILAENGNQSYTVLFDSGHEFDNVDESLLSPEEDRVRELETQLAHLRWRKMQNEAKIRNTLNSTRNMKAGDIIRQLEYNRTHEKAEWVQGIIEDELSRPLEVTEAFMQKFEKDEDSMRNSIELNKDRHLKSVDYIESKIDQREQTAYKQVNQLLEEAAEASYLANDLHNQVIKTIHVLNVDYENIPSEDLDEEDLITMDLLKKRIELLSKKHIKAYEKSKILNKKSSDAMIKLKLSFQPGISCETLSNVNTNSAKFHSGLIGLRDKLKDHGMNDEMIKRERKASLKFKGGGSGGGGGFINKSNNGGIGDGSYSMYGGTNGEASRISPASDFSHDDFANSAIQSTQKF